VCSTVDKALEEALTMEWNINMDGFEFVAISSIRAPDTAYKNWYSVRQKCLLNYSNFKSHDLNPPAQRLWFTVSERRGG
jgi:hypothetical protein